MALSDDLRERVVRGVVDEGMSRNASAKRFGVRASPARCAGWRASRPRVRFRRARWAGSPVAADRGPSEYLSASIAASRTSTLLEIQERLIANRSKAFSSSVMSQFFDHHGITSEPAHAEDDERANVVKAATRPWFTGQPDLDPTSSVFIDEFSGLRPTWRASADALAAAAGCEPPFLMAITRRSRSSPACVCPACVAQKAFDRPIDAASFEEWVEACLAPRSRRATSSLWANLSSHKGSKVEVEQVSSEELHYVPPCGPT